MMNELLNDLDQQEESKLESETNHFFQMQNQDRYIIELVEYGNVQLDESSNAIYSFQSMFPGAARCSEDFQRQMSLDNGKHYFWSGDKLFTSRSEAILGDLSQNRVNEETNCLTNGSSEQYFNGEVGVSFQDDITKAVMKNRVGNLMSIWSEEGSRSPFSMLQEEGITIIIIQPKTGSAQANSNAGPSYLIPDLTSGKYKLQNEITQSVVYHKSQFDISQLTPGDTQPYQSKDWRASELFKLSVPMMEALFFYGQVDSNADGWAYRKMTSIAKTGVGLKLIPLPKSELQLRGGPMITYIDENSATRVQALSRYSLEVLAKMPLFGRLSLQYSGNALRSAQPNLNNQFNQDLKLAITFNSGNQFHIGAKQQIEYFTSQSNLEQTQLYLGFTLKR